MTNTTVQEAVLQTLAGQIAKRLDKLGASEQDAMQQAITQGRIPASVYIQALNYLASMGMIRKFKTKDDITLIAKHSASRKDLSLAANRYRDAQQAAKARHDARRALYLSGKTQATYAKKMPLPEPLDKPELDPEMPGANSQTQTFGDAFHQALIATYEEAQTETQLAKTPREHVSTSWDKAITPQKQRLVQRQIQTGQGARNAQRAKARWLQTEEGQLYLKAQQIKQENIRAERNLLAAEGEGELQMMSPEQAFEHAMEPFQAVYTD